MKTSNVPKACKTHLFTWIEGGIVGGEQTSHHTLHRDANFFQFVRIKHDCKYATSTTATRGILTKSSRCWWNKAASEPRGLGQDPSYCSTTIIFDVKLALWAAATLTVTNASFRLACCSPYCCFDGGICTTAQAPLAAEGRQSSKQHQAS